MTDAIKVTMRWVIEVGIVGLQMTTGGKFRKMFEKLFAFLQVTLHFLFKAQGIVPGLIRPISVYDG